MSYQRQEDEEALLAQIARDKKARRWKWAKRFLLVSLCLWIVGAVVITVLIKSYLNPFVKTQVEQRGSAALGAPLKIEKLAIGLFPTPNVKIWNVEFAMPSAHLSGTTAQGRVGLGVSIYQLLAGAGFGILSIELDEPRLELALPKSEPTPTANQNAEAGDNAPPILPQIRSDQEIGVRFVVREGNLHLTQAPATDAVLERVQFQLDLPSVNKIAGRFSLRSGALVKKDELSFRFPIDLNSEFQVDGNVVNITNAKGEFFGFAFTATGWQNIVSGRADWKLTGLIPELSAVPIPPSFLPPGKWAGKLAASVQASAVSSAKGWKAHAQLDASQIRGTTKIDKNGVVADGSISANASFDVTVDPPSEKAAKEYDIKLNKGYLAADLTEMSIDKEKLFKKAKGIPLVFYFSGAGNQKSVRIEKFDLKFANLAMRSSGTASFEPGTQSALTAVIDKTDLAGWEAYLPPLANSPVKGTLQMNAEIRGDLQKPEGLSIKLNPLLLENFEAGLKWVSDNKETTLTGPVKANARVELTAIGTDLRGATVKLDTDLTAVQIAMKDTLDKKVGLPFTVHLQGAQKGQQIEVKSSAIRIGSSAFNISGRFSNPQRPVLDLKFVAPSLNLAELTRLSPKAAEMAISGSADAKLALAGAYDFKMGVKDSPLRLSGDIAVRMPSYKIARSMPGASPTPAPQNPKNQPPPEPLLPDWVIAKTAQVKLDVTVGELSYGDLPVRGIRLLSSLNKGELDGSLNIQQIFGGTVKAPRFRTRLTTPLPDSMTDLEFNNINMQEAAGFASAEWRDLIKGSATGKMRAMIPHPSSKTFVERIHSWGSIAIRNGFLSTVQIDKAVNETLAKIPGLGNQAAPVNTKGVTADISSEFNAEKKILNLSRFVFLTPEKNELRAQGSIGFDKSIALVGTGYLATAPVGGSVRSANSDAQGRFVVPLKIQGNLLKPEIAFAEETIRQLAAKTAEQELKKGVEKKLDQLKDSVKQKGLEGLKDLFK